MEKTPIKLIPKLLSNKSYYHLFIILFIMQINICNLAFLSSCPKSSSLNNNTCFNDIIKINKKKYRAGYILTNKYNETFIEYSDDSPGDTRLFYSLKENGRGYYFNDTVTKELLLTSNDYYNGTHIIGRYECINEFVYLKTDSNKEKQYLFSISSFLSLTEIHDIENNSYKQWITTDFLGITNKHRYIFSYRFSLLELNNVYFCVYVQYEGTNEKDEDYSVSYTITKFQFKKDNNNEIQVERLGDSVEDNIMYDNRIVSAFLVTKYNIFVVCYVKRENEKISLKYYDYDLKEINEWCIETISNPQPGYGAFFKAINCQYEYAGLMYYTDGDNGKSLKLKFIYIKNKNDQNQYLFEERLNLEIKDYDFKTYTLLNEFYKINPDRFIFASTTSYSNLIIYLIQQYNWYKYVKIMKFFYSLTSTTNNVRFAKEFNFGIYKGFLVFTSTISSNFDNATDFSSYLIFFGYANGTDFTDDVSEYFADIEGYDPM